MIDASGGILCRTRVIASVGCGYGVDGEQRDARIEPERCNAHLRGELSPVEHPTHRHGQITVDYVTLNGDGLS